ncbi:MAG: C1 family peptidase [Chitinophagaceae bacterium]|nr:C1 family peptidase [Chitinophagaceae bacterium]
MNFHAELVGANAGAAKKKRKAVLDARPDTLDFRDKMYQAALTEVPVEIRLEDYGKYGVPILDQGREGACTGYGLATVANYLLRRRRYYPDTMAVSAKMLYQLAKRYDEWPGERYSGSSARGAMKGWHKHGLCKEECWKNDTKVNTFNKTRTSDAVLRPLGAYYRVNHKDLVAMHSAMAEVGVLFATATVHKGWDEVGPDGVIPFTEDVTGGHAFAIVAYNTEGFWIQNSWSDEWGKKGFALISYDDWLKNGSDVWVARLGAPVKLMQVESVSISHSAGARKSNAYSFSDLRPHIISLGNNGALNPGGEYGTTKEEVSSIFANDFKTITAGWKKKRLLIYAHGGLVSETSAVQRLADYRKTLLEAEVYPISLIWHSDMWTTLGNVLRDAIQRRKPEGLLDSAKDFMLDRLDDALEPIARRITGKLQWDEMKENALMATESADGGIRLILQEVAKLMKTHKNAFEIHVIGHSAGSILLAPLVQALTTKGKIPASRINGDTGYGFTINSCTLWAPACTVDLFKKYYVPAVDANAIQRLAIFNLTDDAERDDHCAHIYNKSLLYLVSNSFEQKQRIPLFGSADGTPILGMEKFIRKDDDLAKLFKSGKADLILAPNSLTNEPKSHSTCSSHGSFDDDKATVTATLNRMLNTGNVSTDLEFKHSAASLKDRRDLLNLETR